MSSKKFSGDVRLSIDTSSFWLRFLRLKKRSLYKTAQKAAEIAKARARRRTGFMADHIIAVAPGESAPGGSEIREGRVHTYNPVSAPDDAALLAAQADYSAFVDRRFPWMVQAALDAGAEIVTDETAREEGFK